MDKNFWQDFHAWLDRATVAQLIAARDAAYEQRRIHRGERDIVGDLSRMIRLMTGELLTRSDLVRRIRGRG